ncbi:hypothetical protein N9O40_00865 [Planktomarina sp.]|nr:hypothetical protein [Planktomarina sp.]
MKNMTFALSVISFLIFTNVTYAGGFMFACSPFEFADGGDADFGLSGSLSDKILIINEPMKDPLAKENDPKIVLYKDEYYEIRTANQWHNPSALYEDIGKQVLLIIKPIDNQKWDNGLPPKFKITKVHQNMSLIESRTNRFVYIVQFATCNTIN